MSELLAIVVVALLLTVVIVGAVSAITTPFMMASKFSDIEQRLYDLQLRISELDGDGPDDPDDGEDEPQEQDNVVAFGRKAA